MLVTIGTSFYNNEKTIADTIHSVFAQTFTDWEFLLINDGSSDRSLEIAKSVKDPRVRVISDGLKKNRPFRLNQIHQFAKGKYIALLDADDLMHPQRLEKQVEHLENNPDVEVLGTGLYSFDDNYNLTGILGTEPLHIDPVKAFTIPVVFQGTVMAHTEWFKNNLYDEYFVRVQDVELWCRTLKHTVFDKLQEPLLFYRKGSNVDLKKYRKSYKMRRAVYRKHGPILLQSTVKTKLVILRNYLKEALVHLFFYLGLSKFLILKHYTSIPSDEKEKGEEIINKIINTQVPGF